MIFHGLTGEGMIEQSIHVKYLYYSVSDGCSYDPRVYDSPTP